MIIMKIKSNEMISITIIYHILKNLPTDRAIIKGEHLEKRFVSEWRIPFHIDKGLNIS